jgi:hypothetical protein
MNKSADICRSKNGSAIGGIFLWENARESQSMDQSQNNWFFMDLPPILHPVSMIHILKGRPDTLELL